MRKPQPGPNQVVIDGLAPTVDEHSIKVEGTGAATISEVSVDLLPNREVYEDVYPSDSEDEEEDESESEEEPESMKTINDKIKQLNLKLLDEKEAINSAAYRLRICDNYGVSLATDRPAPNDLESVVKAYNVERQKIFNEHSVSTIAAGKIEEEIAKCEKEKTKLAKILVKEREKEQKEKAKLKEKKLRKKAEIYKEKQRLRGERQSFWPKKVYRITINLESTTLTPGSSRRSSMTASEESANKPNLATTTFHEPTPEVLKVREISLSLSYITYSASWAPRYDLGLNSLKCAGILEYGAELQNTTSETWRDAKVVLSTSQTTFSGLSETIPVLQPWHVRLTKGQRNTEHALMSQSELDAKRQQRVEIAEVSQKPRYQLFGIDNSAQNTYLEEQARVKTAKKAKRSAGVQQMLSSYAPAAPQPSFGGFSATLGAQPTNLFGGIMSSAAPRALAVHREEYSRQRGQEEQEQEESDEDCGFGLFDVDAPSGGRGSAEPNSIVFEEGAWEESGLTTTYDVPGSKTLSPSNSTIKHKIAKIEFKNIVFSHIIVGKLRQVAFLKARLRNASKITLLKGPLSLTLDGSFLGKATFPRCSSGESFTLPLGVDPAIQIAYPKPTVRRSTTGIFSKEDCNVFSRSIVVTNTKHNAPVELTVLDQVPVSEDERLKIEITAPRGLRIGGETVRTGSSATESPAPHSIVKGVEGGTAKSARASVYNSAGQEVGSSGNWGKAEATAKKNGEVAWNVKLNPGSGVKLVLEYEACFPGGEMVVNGSKS
jgi:ribosomal protein L12E/L44/L45/RPP1/RPP2